VFANILANLKCYKRVCDVGIVGDRMRLSCCIYIGLVATSTYVSGKSVRTSQTR
jgi:hypothetical protein